MLSSEDLERLIAAKRCEIEEEKTLLGLSQPVNYTDGTDKENTERADKRVRVSRPRALSENHVPNEGTRECEEEIPADLERYIRRYVGLPVMLKAGEYSPNNPLIRGERASGDVLLGLGEYERRRNTLRKIRQRQYKEYLDQQAKKKQEAKEQAERERREREEKERLREERERERLALERENSPERRRASVSHGFVSGANNTYISKVDTGVQVDHRSTPLSVAVQTEDDQLFRLSPTPKNLLTQAERELSPRTVGMGNPTFAHTWEWTHARRKSYGDYDDRTSNLVKKSCRDKLSSDMRHTYMPSIFDADAIQLRNQINEQEAAERRQSYQQELKNQIMEQQRIREERKNREKMLEQAEMRRLEEQLRTLKMAQDREIERQHDLHTAMRDNAMDYERKRTTLQKEIDLEHQALLKAAIVPPKRNVHTSRSESPKPSKLPFYYKTETDRQTDRPPYSTNIPDNSIFSPSYDVESYLRRNLNPKKDLARKVDSSNCVEKNSEVTDNKVIEKALIHDQPRDYKVRKSENDKKPEFRQEKIEDLLPIPVLRHSPKRQISLEENSSDLSEKMQIVDDKWKVPIVQKNILKSLPNEKGKNVSILTQLGSIRRQLQLEQLKLDKMTSKSTT